MDHERLGKEWEVLCVSHWYVKRGGGVMSDW